jgi:squalene-hopene/tetraprenyl-beta-curcumene cyclase
MEHAAIQRGVQYLLERQEGNGSWYGRWGVNYTYGTCLAVRGLESSHAPTARPAMMKALEWVRSIQNSDGGWGESCVGYEKSRFVAAESTASQTAWALLTLAAGGESSSEPVVKGVHYLLATQKPSGVWDERLATGTGFPGVFYLTYHLYRHYFPMLALATLRP